MKRWLSHFYRSLLSGLCLPSGQVFGFFFHNTPTLRPSPGVCIHPTAKMDLKVKASERSRAHDGLELAPDL